jgi:predicted NAD/FAD-binding protein
MNKTRIAIIGSGISGLAAGWLLRNTAEVSLFEAEARFGGHSHTFGVCEGGREIPIDTGFMVFNRPNYPLLSRLFDELGMRSYATDMSFSVSLDRGRLEYAGSSVGTLFAQRSNLGRPTFWRMLGDILRFNRAARALLSDRSPDSGDCVGDFLDRHRLGERFRQDYLYPMAAAIWSCPRAAIAAFPARSFARFFANHGLINISDRPQWQTLEGGSRAYVSRLVSDLGSAARAASPVRAVRRSADGVELLLDDAGWLSYDHVVFACHADQALRLLGDATPSETAMLRSVPFQSNRVLLHRDPALMPVRRSVWSSWNYLDGSARSGDEAVSVTYWMNSLQRLPTRSDYFVTLNPVRDPEPRSVIAEFDYHHPVFDMASLQLKSRLETVQGRRGTWFCGAWTGYGFHEDGMRSAVDVALKLGASLPWEEQIQASRALYPTRMPAYAAQQA